MSRHLAHLSLVLTTSAAFAFTFGSLFAQDVPAGTSADPEAGVQAPDAPEEKTEEADKTSNEEIQLDENEEIQLDENAPEEQGQIVDESVASALSEELQPGDKENSAEDLLNLATELKLSAKNMLDLSKVIALCQEAEKKGLDESNLEFSKQLRISAQLDRGLTIAQLFLNPEIQIEQLPRGWEALRDAAIGDLETALAENGELPVAKLAVGRLYMLKDELEKAKSAFEAAFGNDEADAQVKSLALKFRAELEQDETKAIELLEKAIESVPDAAELRAQLAAAFLSARRLDDALTQIDKALETAEQKPEYQRIKATILAEAGKVDEAKALFDESTQGREDDVLVQIEKGQFLASIDQYDAAIEHFTKLIDKYGGPGLFFLRGVLFLQTKEYDKALADVNKALRMDASMTQALRVKGIILLEQKKYDDAIRIFEQLKRKSSDKTEATTQIAFATAKKGLYKKASKMLDDELAKTPDSVDVLRSYADMELMFGHWQAAAQKYERLLELVPNDSGVLNNYSWLLGTCPDDSIRNGEKALEYGLLASEKTFYAAPHILSTLAAAYAENGDFEKAREWSQKAVELGEKERHESLDSLKEELNSYKENKPWRETSEIVSEVEEEAPAASEPNEKDAETTEPAAPQESEPQAQENEGDAKPISQR